MPSLRQRIRASDRAPLRLPLVFPSPAATYEYRVNGATGTTDNQDVNADGEFLAGLFYRNAQGVITNAEYAITWQGWAQGQLDTGEIVSLLGRNRPPARQVGLVLTSVDSAGVLAQFGAGQYRVTRLDAATFLPDSPVASTVDLNIVSVQAAPAATVGLNLDLGDAVMLNVATWENALGDRESTAPFALRITGLATGRTRYEGTLFAARQDSETVQALIQASGQLAYSAERLYLTRYVEDLRPGQSFTAEGRRWTVVELRRVARRHLLISADSLS